MSSRWLAFTGVISIAFLSVASLSAKAAEFREYPIGDAIEKAHMKLAAVYFPAVPMDHSAMGHSGGSDSSAEIAKEKFAKPGQELIHLEADIHALKDNPNGFGAGEWIPYLSVKYKLGKKNGKSSILEGELMPMVAKDGPHYGTTIRMPGKGRYVLTYTISAPQLARHTDPLTGVAEYWTPFQISYDMDYAGIPKN